MRKDPQFESTEFLGFRICYSENVLTPRLETEALVLGVVKRISRNKIEWIFDIWTGSGVIALALSHYFPESEIFWVDVSSEALQVAEHNIKLNNADITLLEGNLLSPLARMDLTNIWSKFLLIANLPYVWANDEVGEDVLVSDPDLALYGWWESGFDLIERFLDEVRTGFDSTMNVKVALEFWHSQVELLLKWCTDNHVPMETWSDYSWIERFALLDFSPMK